MITLLNDTPADFTAAEIADAQAALDLHHDDSPYWDSRSAQDIMRIARICELTPRTTNEERRELYRQACEEKL